MGATRIQNLDPNGVQKALVRFRQTHRREFYRLLTTDYRLPTPSFSYAILSHFFTCASMSSTLPISIRCVMRSFFASPPVSMSRLGAAVAASANPRSMVP